MFPSLGATSTAQPQTGGFTSMFSNPSAPQQSTTGGQQPSLFNTASTQQQPQSQQPGGSLAQANAGSGRSTHFDHLLSLQLGLGDIARKVRNLGAGGPSADQARDGTQDRAAYVLRM
jgi:nuclear pore complex protein Nup93